VEEGVEEGVVEGVVEVRNNRIDEREGENRGGS
jgi:hypothetical protein